MKNIAVLSCGKVKCTFGGCLNAFYDREKAFEPYAGKELRMVAMMRCPECMAESDPMISEAFVKNLERVSAMENVTLHIGHCAAGRAEKGCEGIKRMARAYEEKGVEVVDYNAGHAQYFDRMPGAKTATLCPGCASATDRRASTKRREYCS